MMSLNEILKRYSITPNMLASLLLVFSHSSNQCTRKYGLLLAETVLSAKPSKSIDIFNKTPKPMAVIKANSPPNKSSDKGSIKPDDFKKLIKNLVK